MRAGKIRHLITIEQNAPTQDASGGMVDNWTTFASVYAAGRALRGRELAAAQAVNNEVFHVWQIRFLPGLTPEMRISFAGKHFSVLWIDKMVDCKKSALIYTAEGMIDKVPPAPVLLSVVSRKTHGSAGQFDLPLSLTSITTEPRRQGGYSNAFEDTSLELRLTFDWPVTSGDFVVAEGAAQITGTTFDGYVVSVTIGPMQDRQYLTIQSQNINGVATASIRFCIQRGDTNSDGLADAADIAAIDAHVGEPITNANCMFDTNCDGVISAGAVENVSAPAAAMHASTLPIISSRRYHGVALYPFDKILDQTQAIGDSVSVEPRMTTPDYVQAAANPNCYAGPVLPSFIVFAIAEPVVSVGTPTAVDSLGNNYGSSVTASILGNMVIVRIDGGVNAKRVTVTAPNINGATTLSVSVGFLIGDLNNSRTVTGTDITTSRSRNGISIFRPDATTFLCDSDCDGAVDSPLTVPPYGTDSIQPYSGLTV